MKRFKYHLIVCFLSTIFFSFAFVIPTYALDHVNINETTEKFTKHEPSKEFISTGEPIYLDIFDADNRSDFKSIHVTLKKQVQKDGKQVWEAVEEHKYAKKPSKIKFVKNIARGVKYRIDFSFQEERTFGTVVTYAIKQREPKKDKYPKEIDDLVPTLNLEKSELKYQPTKDGKPVNVIGNLTYAIDGQQHNVIYIDNKNEILLPPFTLNNKHKIVASFVGDDYQQLQSTLKGYSEDSIMQFGRTLVESNLEISHKQEALKIQQKTNNQDLIVTATTTTKAPSTSKEQAIWNFHLVDKKTKKTLASSPTLKAKANQLTESHTFKKSDFKGNYNVEILVTLQRTDTTSQKENDQIVIFKGEGRTDAKYKPDNNQGGNNNGNDDNNNRKNDKDGKNDKDDKPKQVNSKIQILEPTINGDQVEISATLTNTKQAKGNWTLTFNKGNPIKKDNVTKTTVKESFSLKGITEKQVPVSITFKGQVDGKQVQLETKENVTINKPAQKKEKEPKIQILEPTINGDQVEISATLTETKQVEGNWTLTFNKGNPIKKDNVTETTVKQSFSLKGITEKQVPVSIIFKGKADGKQVQLETTKDITINKPAQKKEGEEPKISIYSTILDGEQVEITAKLENVEEPKGKWELTFHDKQPETFEDEDQEVKKTFSTKNLSENEVSVTAQFQGKDKNGKEVNLNNTEKVQVKSTTSDTQPNLKSGNDVGGPLPKTSTNYYLGILIGLFCLAGGLLVLHLRRI